jgi:hypothetical protein
MTTVAPTGDDTHASSRGDHRPPPHIPGATVAWNVGAASRSSFFRWRTSPFRAAPSIAAGRPARAQLRGAISLLRSPGRGRWRAPARPRSWSTTPTPRGHLRPLARLGPPSLAAGASARERLHRSRGATTSARAATEDLRPPCHGRHRYSLRLYALDSDPRLRPGAGKARRRARRRGPHREARADRQLRAFRRNERRPGSRSRSGARAYSWRAPARSLGM